VASVAAEYCILKMAECVLAYKDIVERAVNLTLLNNAVVCQLFFNKKFKFRSFSMHIQS
jgi:hypothetical protein